MNAEATFRAKAPGIMAKLLSDFPIGVEDAAAIMGNAGHESKGLTDDQEDKPTVPGSRGGLNWMQWTGPRRRAMEAYCARNKLDPNSDAAAYKWLFLELKGIEGTEGKAIAKTVAAKTLDDKVVAFEKAFLRAGVKHYESRKQWARIAMDAWKKAGNPASLPTQPDVPTYPQPEPAPSTSKPARGRFVLIAVLLLAAVAAVAFIITQVRF